MKKILCLIAVVMLLASCSQGERSSRELSPLYNVTTLHFNMEGHDYLLFTINNRWAGIEHDPNCECMIDCD